MKRRNNITITLVKIIIVLLLTGYTVFLNIRISRLNSRLKTISVFTYNETKENPLKVQSLYEIVRSNEKLKSNENLLNPDFTDFFTRLKSPFNDGLSYQELLEKYIRYGMNDHYGSPRRTGNIRRIHEGLDFFVPENTPVYPLSSIGIVTEVSDDPNYELMAFGTDPSGETREVMVEYGKIVRILYPEGIESLYAHLNEVFVEEGEVVCGETAIGLTGYTGNIAVSGKPSHLHLELRDKNNSSFNPLDRLHYNSVSFRHFIEEYQKLLSKRELDYD